MEPAEKAAKSLYDHRRLPGDPLWEEVSFLVKSYYLQVCMVRIRSGLQCDSVSPLGGEKCILVPGHEGMHECNSTWK